MKDAPITTNGIHPSTKMNVPAAAAVPVKLKPETTAPKPTLADKLYGKKLGLRGKPKE